MKQKWRMLTAILFITIAAGFVVAPSSAVADTSQNQTWLPDSLHWTLRGMEYWYSGDGDTFDSLEDITGVPYSAFDDPATGCMNCHPKDAIYPTDPSVACGDDRCHGVDAPTDAPNWGTVYEMQMTAGQGCLKCHGREYWMMHFDDLDGTPDVHRDGSGTDKDYCTACHTTREIHDIGDPYYSLKEPGAMDTTCDTCHTSGPGTTPPSNYSHDTHTDSLHCTACHQRRVTSCYNCHVDTAYATGPRVAKAKLTDWLFLVNYDGKVHSANMQSFVGGDNDLVWGEGNSNHINEGYEEVALMFAPVHSHSIMTPGRACADCHATDIVEEIYDYGETALTWLDGSTLEHLTGVIPVVESTTYNLVAYDKDNTVGTSTGWESMGLLSPDAQYEIADGSALTATQLARLNYAATGDFEEFEDGIHNTYRGMQYWYEGVGSPMLKDIVGVDYDDFDHAYQGCKNCHGAGGTGELPWPMNCDTCHGVSNPTGPPWVSDPDEIEPTCLRCHARESVMKAYDDSVGTPDVHRAKGMSCMECHSSREVHNIGLEYDSHKDIGAMDTKCTDCHTTGPGTPQPGDYAHSVHTATVDCSACHQRRVISCYNCHMDTAVDGPMRMARTQIRDWLFLMNYDGKVTAANMQSFVGGDNSVTGGPNEEWSTYDERALMFAPMYSHSTMKEGRTCTDCHNTATVQDIRADGELDLTWLDGSNIGHPSGVIPVGAYTDYYLLWYDKDNTVTSSPTWWLLDSTPSLPELDLKICNGTGLTVGQMGELDNSNFNAFGHSAHLTDAKGPRVASCTACHLSATPENGNAPLADEQTFANTGICDDCHSPLGDFDGVDDATIGCKANWETGVYEADGKTLQSGKEQWCAGCHDDVPASNIPDPVQPTEVVVDDGDPGYSTVCTWNHKTGKGSRAVNGDFDWLPAGDGSCTATWTPDLPDTAEYNVYAWWYANPYRATDAEYTINCDGGTFVVEVDQTQNGEQWNLLGTYQFAAGTGGSVVLSDDAGGQVIADAVLFVTAGVPSVAYAPTVTGDNSTWGYFVNGHWDDGLLYCDTCHDASKRHIDGDWRTYEVDDAAGVAINAYVDSFRLKDVDGQPALVMPRRRPPGNPMNAMADFALCVDCHSAQEVLSIDVGHTNFWNDDADDRNAHYIHLGLRSSKYDSDDDGARDSAISCVSCHNPHGTPAPALIRHGEMISTPGTTDKVPALNFSYVGGATLATSTGGQMAMAGASMLANGVCDNCHGATSYSRTPVILPKVIDGTADPDTAPPDATTEVVLSALIVDDDGSLSGVTVDLSEIGGSASEIMYDDGDPDHGDADAGDGFYSCKTTVSTDTGFGLKNLTVTATNAQGSGINVIQLNVLVAGVYIIDDPAAEYTETWKYVSKSGAYNGDLHFKDAGTGSGTATYTPDIDAGDAGTYKVYAWWKPYWNRATNAPYTITYNGGSVTVYKDQTVFSGDWELLGTYPFAAGTGGSVVLSDDADGQLIADGIKFEKQ